MRTYIYCSYQRSPVGFQMGIISYNAGEKNFYIPIKEGLNSFVVKAFEQGFVSKVYGIIPESKKYIFLVKGLQQSNIEDANEGLTNFYMNFAFEFDKLDEFNSFCANFNEIFTSGTVAEECAKFIVPDRTIDTFALKIKADVFNRFLEKMLHPSAGKPIAEKTFVEVISARIDESKLKETFGYDFEKLPAAKVFRYPVEKKNAPMTDITIIAIVAVMVVMIIILVRWFLLTPS